MDGKIKGNPGRGGSGCGIMYNGMPFSQVLFESTARLRANARRRILPPFTTSHSRCRPGSNVILRTSRGLGLRVSLSLAFYAHTGRRLFAFKHQTLKIKHPKFLSVVPRRDSRIPRAAPAELFYCPRQRAISFTRKRESRCAGTAQSHCEPRSQSRLPPRSLTLKL